MINEWRQNPSMAMLDYPKASVSQVTMNYLDIYGISHGV